jgi:hypothetical protein
VYWGDNYSGYKKRRKYGRKAIATVENYGTFKYKNEFIICAKK